jgi:hypothetical protein
MGFRSLKTGANGPLAMSNASAAVPTAPIIGTATRSEIGVNATVTFTPSIYGSAATSYTVIASSGGVTQTGASSPITIFGLSGNTTYTFTVVANNANGSSTPSAATNSITTIQPVVATGGTIATPGDGFRYHTFTGSGTFQVTAGTANASVLVVAGGGGGAVGAINSGMNPGSGGGAGGVVSGPITISSTSGPASNGIHSVSIGGGGAAAPTSFAPTGLNQATSGTPSSFAGLTTAVGGGYAISGAWTTENGFASGPGGSSGGAGNYGSFGSSTPGQGNPGGTPGSPSPSNYSRMGGGGAAARAISYADGAPVGLPGKTVFQAYGGAGTLSPLTGSYYGGGGAGVSSFNQQNNGGLDSYMSNGGIGGGGSGAIQNTKPNPQGGPNWHRGASAGTANTGGGGGGGDNIPVGGLQPAAAGGSGVVIVRYPA